MWDLRPALSVLMAGFTPLILGLWVECLTTVLPSLSVWQEDRKNIKLPKQLPSQKYLNIYIKAPFWSKKTSTSNHFWNLKIPSTNHVYLGEKLLKQKVAKIAATSFGSFAFSKKSQWASKSSLIGKNCLILSSCSMWDYYLLPWSYQEAIS